MSAARTGIARRVAVPVTAVLITAAAVLWHHLPVPTEIYAPFDVYGNLGSPVRGHALSVTATRVRVAPKGKFALSQFTSEKISATGLWFVVDATLSAIEDSELPSADLVVGGNTYQVSLRSPARGFGIHVDPGLPQHGYWVFDVAPELIQPSITTPLQLRVWSNGEERLNSRLVINLEKPAPERVDIVAVKPYEVGPAG
ncbi:MAG TPA: hypothetical protein VGG53_14185 [Mycobacterium sp.]|uniref:hypothetical protein n=1 Tax=Mycobacterium sp. TaxID=1785 RepID=UPI002F3FBC73